MTLAIAILNYNGADLLKRFLPSVLAHAGSARVYVIDNGSTDNTVQILQEQFPPVTCIPLPQNHGYAKGYNLGVEQIDAELLCLLNSDVEVTPNWTIPLMEFFSTHPEVAIAQPKIKDLERPDYFEYAGAAGGYLDVMGLPYCRGRVGSSCEKDIGQYDKNARVTWASGACLFVRKSVFEAVGGFDASFFMHFEEIDLCLRVQALGHQVWALGNSEVFHQGAASLSKSSPKKLHYNIRNSLLTYIKNISLLPLLWLFMARLAFDTTLALLFMVQGKFEHIRALADAYDDVFKRFRITCQTRTHTQNPLRLFIVLLRF